ncbi:MAG: hypothetical protein RMJ00_06885 [Nitrososphaerota archaeon]|nr:hypothetical protein [Candidatus Bathyarchaeota archaeon]MCX8162288.1 hypothetical protein [Candidatus Bathyarchaeota archaeon]MDW8062407.1 hypothetical protein [Nitrososphaerota archaeon]
MAVRIKLKVRSPSREMVTSALVNSGFEAETPQLLIPRSFALNLGLWPPPIEAQLVEVGTAGGPVRNYLIQGAIEVSAITSDRIVGPVRCDAMISNLDARRRAWRFSDEDRVRSTEAPQYWF